MQKIISSPSCRLIHLNNFLWVNTGSGENVPINQLHLSNINLYHGSSVRYGGVEGEKRVKERETTKYLALEKLYFGLFFPNHKRCGI
jgi:hypothetical protein